MKESMVALRGLLVAILLVPIIPMFGAAGEDAQHIAVIRSDERGIVFEYRPEFTPVRIIEEGNRRYQVFDFTGSQSDYTHEMIGQPDLRYHLIPLGFPGSEGHAVQILAADYEDISGVAIAPLPTHRLRDDMLEIEGYTPDASAYGQNSFIPAEAALIGSVGRTRSMFVGAVKVFPVQYHPASGVVRKYSRIVVEVVYGAQSGQRVRNNDDLVFRDHLLNYNIAREWKFTDPTVVTRSVAPSVLAVGDWYRISVTEEGAYILNAQYLSGAGINVGAIDPRTIKIYGHGGKELPESPVAPRPEDLLENSIFVQGESDGQFNNDDYIVFYGKGTRGWDFNTSTRVLNHYINRYTETNYYWMTFGGANGRRMEAQPSLSDIPTLIPDRFRDGVFVEEERINLIASGKDWFGPQLNSGSSFTYTNVLPGLVPDDNIVYRYRLVARAQQSPVYTVREGNTVLSTNILSTVRYGDEFYYAHDVIVQAMGTSSLLNNTSQLNFQYNADNSAIGWIDWAEIQYPRRFTAVNNALRFRSPDSTAVVEYRIEGLTQSPMILNVTDPANARQITGIAPSYSFRSSEQTGVSSHYYAVAANGFRTPAGITRMPNQNLRGYADGADFIIVTSQEFRSAADRLKAHREQAAHGGLRTIVVDVDQIYNEFAGGLPDITAIRDYLKYAYDTWSPSPRFALFFGGASYDYKGLLGSKSSYVPTWQSQLSIHGVDSYSTEDFFVKFGTSARTYMTIGRIPSRASAEAHTVVDKIIGYDQSSARDFWKMRILFIGDDSWTSEGGERSDGTIHSAQTETLAELYTPPIIEKRKIYIAEYPTVLTAQGRRKPGAYQDIIDEINRGALIVNYVGHGNPTVWAHESIFIVQTSIPSLVNADRLALFIMATCNFSQFDDPRRYTGSELMLNKPDGGAIAAVSATRRVYSSENARFNQDMYQRMFSRDLFGRVTVERPATAIYLVKSFGSNSPNDQKFCFLGDPTMHLQYPRGFAVVDTINEEPVDTVNGVPRQTPIQLHALSRVTVTGSIRDQANAIDSSFNGVVSLIVNDATRRVTIVAFVPQVIINGVPYPQIDWPYNSTGGTIYRGESSVRNGVFTATFIVPKDILYADSTGRGRLVVSFFDNNRDGAGYTSNFRVGGTDTTAPPDHNGPDITLYLDTRSFRPGDMVSESPLLIADLRDSSGINTSGSGIGHRIEAWLNNSAQSVDLTDFYSGKLDSYQEGTVQYQLRGLPHGRSYLKLRAWDTYNNASSAETSFEVTSTDKLQISDIFNYPNPFADGTSFTFRQNQSVPLNITVKVYTLAGRLIQSIESASAGEPFIKIPWDGRDRDGDILANGVYLYKVIARTVDGRFSSEALGKLSVLK